MGKIVRKTKIICTLGPAVDNEELLRQLMRNGMDCARFNFSHGTHAEQKERMDRVKRLREEMGLPVAILLDTKGPEIRLGKFEDGRVELKSGQDFTLDADLDTLGDGRRAGVTHRSLGEHIDPGMNILIDDGKVGLEVVSVRDRDICCRVLNGGRISDRKSLNVPGVAVPMPYMTEADKADILFGISQEVDFIAASFVRSAEDIKLLRGFLLKNGGDDIKIISKIESTQGLKNLNDIIELSDGIMIARGDLGVELPFRDIPPIQKKIISRCMNAGKIVVTATQMLESMTKSPRPTRAEVSDVANAVYDGTTAIMLSGESAAGDYPAEAVLTMAQIAESAEASIDYKTTLVRSTYDLSKTVLNTTCLAACYAADYIDAAAIVAVTRSGRTAAAIADFKPDCPIIAAAIDERGRRQLNLCWGVLPVEATVQPSIEALLKHAKSLALGTGVVKKGDTIVVVIGSSVDEAGISDTIRIMRLD